jgi:hypothetical protein
MSVADNERDLEQRRDRIWELVQLRHPAVAVYAVVDWLTENVTDGEALDDLVHWLERFQRCRADVHWTAPVSTRAIGHARLIRSGRTAGRPGEAQAPCVAGRTDTGRDLNPRPRDNEIAGSRARYPGSMSHCGWARGYVIDPQHAVNPQAVDRTGRRSRRGSYCRLRRR